VCVCVCARAHTHTLVVSVSVCQCDYASVSVSVYVRSFTVTRALVRGYKCSTSWLQALDVLIAFMQVFSKNK